MTEEPEEPVVPPTEEPSDPSGEGSGTDTEVRPGDNGVSGDKETEESAAATDRNQRNWRRLIL